MTARLRIERERVFRMTPEIRAFFEQYRDAFDRLDGDAVARLYAVPSGIASDTGYEHWPAYAPIRENMIALCDLYRANDYLSATFEPGAFIAQGEGYAVADIAWNIERRGAGAPWRFSTTYNLMRTAEGWRVLLCTAYSEKRLDASVAAPALSKAASFRVLSKLRALGVELPPGPVRIDGYGDSAALSEALLALIRQGRKRAGTSLLWAMQAENQTLPVCGDIEIVLDHHNEPALITRITRVDVVAYAVVTAAYAAIEGEGDGSLEYWRNAHWAFFSRECVRIGRVPTQDMPVVCSTFELLSVVPASAEPVIP